MFGEFDHKGLEGLAMKATTPVIVNHLADRPQNTSTQDLENYFKARLPRSVEERKPRRGFALLARILRYNHFVC